MIRLLAVKRYSDYRKKADYAFVDVEKFNDDALKRLIQKLKEKKIRNIGDFFFAKIHNNSLLLDFFYNGIPEKVSECFSLFSVPYLKFDELLIMEKVMRNYLEDNVEDE